MRDLDWQGIHNVRDLGQLPTALSETGGTIPGRIARGPRRELLTDTGWRQARSWGLQTVIDLRCDDEIGRRPADPRVDIASEASVAIIDAPTEDHDNAEFRETCFPILDSPAYWAHNLRILPHLVRTTFEQIATARTGILVHCSAGRDRTGMVSALLLGNAGVPPDVVAEDYAQSVRAMAGVASHAPTHDRQATWTAKEVETWLGETVWIVRQTAAATDDAFDTIGLAAPVRARLRALLTRVRQDD
ncbi:tyrosine-protein phosphatase [Plantibacter sp. YIM 135249]|uniref:tyrosine-protein phosphatase n=1 Tax=Plantibacter sp. YIM 135249 TaxID=3423918 RepID=UPI003D333294